MFLPVLLPVLNQVQVSVILPVIYLTSGLGTKDVFNLVTKMHAQSGITNVADVYNLSKYNSRIMAAFLPEYEKVELWKIFEKF